MYGIANPKELPRSELVKYIMSNRDKYVAYNTKQW